MKKIDLVDVPATGRTITLFKSGDNTDGDAIVDKETLLNAIAELDDEGKQEVVKALGIEVPEPKELTADEILKALDALKPKDDKTDDVPESVKKSIETLGERLEKSEKEAEEARAEIAKMREEERQREYTQKAGDLRNLPGVNAEDFGPILAKVEKALKPDEWKKLDEVLRGADTAISDSKLFAEIGRDSIEPDSVRGKLEAAADEIRKSQPDMTLEQARAKALKDNPALYDALKQEEEDRKRR